MKVLTPMPGRMLCSCKKHGDSVCQGEIIAIVESMKMEIKILAPATGKISYVVKVASL